MNPVVKILLGVLATVVLLFVLLIVAVTLIFEPNDYRPLLVRAVEDATGRTFALDGDLGLKLLPCCGVSLGRATLGNPPGFPEEPLLSVESAVVSVKIWPLLTRRDVEIGTITLQGVDARLVKLADGSGNWEFAESESTTEAASDTESPISSLTIEGLQIRNGSVRYQDLATKAAYAAQDIDVATGPIGGAETIPVSVSLRASDEVNRTTADISLDSGVQLNGDQLILTTSAVSVAAAGDLIPTGKVDLDLKAADIHYDLTTGTGQAAGVEAQVSLPGSRIITTGEASFGADTLTASGSLEIGETRLRELLAALPDAAFEPVDDKVVQSLRGSARWSATAEHAEITDLDLKLDDSRISGNAEISDFADPRLAVDLRIDSIDVDRYQTAATESPATSASTDPVEIPFDLLADLPTIDAKVRFDLLRASGIDLNTLELTLKNQPGAMSMAVAASTLGGRLALTGSGNPAARSPQLSGNLELKNLSPRQALTALDETFETTDPNVLSTLSGTASWRLQPNSFEMSAMQWSLDSTQLTGNLNLADFATPAINFKLSLDNIDLDRYLAPEDETAPADTEDVEIPADMIRELNLNGQLTAGRLKVADLQLTNLAATISAANGILTMQPLTASLYGGTYRGSIRIDASGATSQLTLDQELSSVQLNELLPALLQSDRLAGSISLKLQGSGSGNSQTELLRGLSGDFNFNLADGLYRGMDIAYEIESAQALLKRSAAPETPDRRETPIKALAFSGKLIDGMLKSDDLRAEIPHLILGGAGGVNLIDRSLDYQLNAQVLKSATNTADSVWRSLAGNTIPLTIKGPMSAPKVGVNLQGLIVETVKEQARNALLKQLGVGSETTAPAAETTATGAAGSAATPAATDTEKAASDATEAPPEEPEAEAPTPEDLLKQGLRNLFKKPDSKPPR